MKSNLPQIVPGDTLLTCYYSHCHLANLEFHSHSVAMFHPPELSALDRVYADAISPLCKSVLVHHPLHGTVALFVLHLRQTTAAKKGEFHPL